MSAADGLERRYRRVARALLEMLGQEKGPGTEGAGSTHRRGGAGEAVTYINEQNRRFNEGLRAQRADAESTRHGFIRRDI